MLWSYATLISEMALRYCQKQLSRWSCHDFATSWRVAPQYRYMYMSMHQS